MELSHKNKNTVVHDLPKLIKRPTVFSPYSKEAFEIAKQHNIRVSLDTIHAKSRSKHICCVIV